KTTTCLVRWLPVYPHLPYSLKEQQNNGIRLSVFRCFSYPLEGRMSTPTKTQPLQDQLRQANERLLLSAFKAQDSAERAKATLALLEAVLHQMPGGVIIVDAGSD